jgi:hypothetical protein
MSSDFLGSAPTTAFPSTTSSTVSSPQIRHRSGFNLSSDDLPRQVYLDPNYTSTSASALSSKVPGPGRPDGLTREPSTEPASRKGSIGRNMIEGLQLDALRERISKLPRMEMPEIKMPTPNLDVDVQ